MTFPKPAEGSWTEHHPDLGTDPMSYEDCISPALHDLERDAIFRRAWLMVGREEQVGKVGSYFTKSVDVLGGSIVVVRESPERLRAFHNICRHRGNQLVWHDDPSAEVSGTCRQFTCKYHGWRYGLDGAVAFVQQEDEFLDFDRADFGLKAVHCDIWAGFVFVNFADEPEQSLAEFLGPLGARLGDYPFGELTSRFSYRSEIKANWKLYMDAFQEFYHAPVLHASQSPDSMAHAARDAGFHGAHYEMVGPHRMVTTSGLRPWELPERMLKPMERITRSGLFGPWAAADLRVPEGLNPPKVDPWGLDSFQFFPNFAVLTWSQGWVVTYQYWPTSFRSHIFEGNLYFPPAATARERVAQEMAAVTFKEYALQDASTLEATQSMLETRAVTHFPLNDQEVLCRHLHMITAEWVAEHRRRVEVPVG
jgi:Rieske 2Fe-2S family protein